MSRREFLTKIVASGAAVQLAPGLNSGYLMALDANTTKQALFAEYSDPDGCLALTTNSKVSPSTDNSMLFTAEKLVIIGPTRDGEVDWFRNHILSCMTKDEGFIRHPNKRNPTAYDDLIGAFAFLKHYNFIQDAQNLFNYMDRQRNRHPPYENWYNKNNWLGHTPHLVPFADLCCNQSPGAFGLGRISIAFSLNEHDAPSETNGRCILNLMSKIMDGHGHFYAKIVSDWQKDVMRKYPGAGMRGAYKVYFGANHPMAVYAPVM